MENLNYGQKWQHIYRPQFFTEMHTEITNLRSEVNEKLNYHNKPNNDGLLTINEACEILKVSKVTLWRYRKKGLLNSSRLAGVGVRFEKTDVLSLLKSINYV